MFVTPVGRRARTISLEELRFERFVLDLGLFEHRLKPWITMNRRSKPATVIAVYRGENSCRP